MYVIALTGGIGSGKSTVSQLFAQLGIDIIDTDLIAREMVRSGSLVLEKIQEHFGRSVIDSDGELKRAVLRKKIFANPDEKAWLESLLHPLIREEVSQRVQLAEPPYCIVVIPLLFETSKIEFINRILVVDSPQEMQIERVMARDNCKQEEVQTIMQSQISSQSRREGADDIIDNDGSLEHLKAQVNQLHASYLKLSQ